MRTSNKILIAIMVFVFASVTVIYGMLRLKYNRGEFITRDAYDAGRSDLIKANSFKTIELVNCAGVSMEKSDSFSIRLNKHLNREFVYRFDGDKLVVEGKGDEPGVMVWASVHIKSPVVESIHLKNSRLYLSEYDLSSLQAEISGESSLVISSSRIGSFAVSATDNSSLELEEKTEIQTMFVSLSGYSSLRSGSGKIGKLHFRQISDSATLELDGRSFRALADTSLSK